MPVNPNPFKRPRPPAEPAGGLPPRVADQPAQPSDAYWLAQGMFLYGCALAAQRHTEEGIAQIRQGLSAYRATGAVVLQPIFLGWLAEVYMHDGQTTEALGVVTEALGMAEDTAQPLAQARLYRLKGELLRQAGQREKSGQAEKSLSQALDLARDQRAKSLELQAAMSLSRLWHEQGKRDTGRQLLTSVYDSFTEGFDTRNLTEAKALLDELCTGPTP